jgi:nicotinamide mononucleotide transporter
VIERFLAPAFMAWGNPVSWLEIVAFALSIAMVIANQRQWIVAWPLAMASSFLYSVLFWHGQLFGEAALQLFFILLAGWGWLQWARGVQGQALPVQRLGQQGWLASLLTIAIGGPLLGFYLDHHTPSPLPYWDALPTVASVVATILLGRKFIENWPFWIGINTVSVGLFALKGYWLTVILYTAFIPLAAWGWRLWAKTPR